MPNCEPFTLTAQTSSALRRTLRFHAALIEDVLHEGYKFVLTSQFQSDPLERRYGQYRQMSERWSFLVGLKDISCLKKILKIKSLVIEGFDINHSVKVDKKVDEELEMSQFIQRYFKFTTYISFWKFFCISVEKMKTCTVHINL